ncbi:MAG TPA: hypothetical protein VFB62_25985, partial [Polyangiaceae bacterium]|nr:hypothetical protein [Polyangiaceae bacterium]
TVHRLIGEEPMFPTSWDSAELFAIGDQASTNVQCVGYDLDGVIDELRIWSGRRTQEELDATYLTTVDCDTGGLIGYWRFEEATGGTIGNCAGPEVLQINDGTEPRDYQWVDSPFDE